MTKDFLRNLRDYAIGLFAMDDRFRPEPEQVAAFARWLKYPEIIKMLALQMPLCGGPRSACEERITDVSDALLRVCYGEARE